MSSASFDSTKTPLQDLLERAHVLGLQLPDFQRGWVWDDERIKSLLASVSASFPIGAVMLLQTGGDHIRFKPRPLAGTDETLHADPETLILDGQQRLTSLYQALMSTSAVETKDAKGKPIRRWYYLDMKKAVAPEADDAVLCVPEDRQVKAFGGEITVDVTTPAPRIRSQSLPREPHFRQRRVAAGLQRSLEIRSRQDAALQRFRTRCDQALRAIPNARDRAQEGDPEGGRLPGLRAR